jgi:membrane protease YdiL (CAAX protease family)
VSGPGVVADSRRSARRPAVLAVTVVAGAGLLWATFHTTRGEAPFWLAGFALAAVWIGGAMAMGGVGVGRTDAVTLVPAALGGAVAFVAFYVAYRLLRDVAVLGGALHRVSGTAASAHLGALVALAIVNSVAEEMFFRGALVDAVATRSRSRAASWRGLAVSVAVYAVVTAASGNVALVIAAAVMGALFALLRWWGDGVAAPILCHAVWSTLMLLAIH